MTFSFLFITFTPKKKTKQKKNKKNTCNAYQFLTNMYKNDKMYLQFFFSKECLEGNYGPNCADMCSNYCGVPQKCDSQTGECKDGCQIGWKKPLCKERRYF